MGHLSIILEFKTPWQMQTQLAIRATIYRSLRALRAQNRKKVSKRVFLGVRKKVPENTRKSQKIHQKVQFWVFFDFFGYFRGLFCGPPKRLFLRLFCDFGPGGPGDSCKWSLGSQDTAVFFGKSLRLRSCDCQSRAICDCDCVGQCH